MRRAPTALEAKYYQEESDRLVNMIKNHPDAGKGKPTPAAIMRQVEMARGRLYEIGYRPTSKGLFMIVEDDPVNDMNASNDNAWSSARLKMHDALRSIQEKAAGA